MAASSCSAFCTWASSSARSCSVSGSSKRDGSLRTVSDLLGHADVKTTLNLYVNPGMAQKKACVNGLVG
ncbi:MAG: hypothetical protein IKR72_02190 [Bacteroidales bacterium]|nr:hypothetical protein [Bacteroidales bacterium]